MKPIPVYNAKTNEILTANEGTAADALARVNGKAMSFVVTSLVELSEIAEETEDLLDARGLRQDLRTGVEVSYTPAGPTAKSYKYGATSTRVTLKRSGTGVWKLIGAERVTVYPKNPVRRVIRISEDGLNYIRERAVEPFTVIKL